MKRTAAEKFAEYTEDIKTALRDIEKAVEDYYDGVGPGTKNWGHVGDVAEVRNRLNDVRDFLTGSGEYAS